MSTDEEGKKISPSGGDSDNVVKVTRRRPAKKRAGSSSGRTTVPEDTSKWNGVGGEYVDLGGGRRVPASSFNR